jgi:hypothetical protein
MIRDGRLQQYAPEQPNEKNEDFWPVSQRQQSRTTNGPAQRPQASRQARQQDLPREPDHDSGQANSRK